MAHSFTQSSALLIRHPFDSLCHAPPLLGTHYPDLAIGVAPLSGMATLGTTEGHVRGHQDVHLHAIIDASVAEYRGEQLAVNLRGLPFIARTGANDRVINPLLTRRMGQLVGMAGVEGAVVEELPGLEHWWWD